ncbi:MAG: hypothetical protein J1F09_01700 [Oscillospiraceae bacterium]|nr:hypothetical protein [Oscillospiraceae bacterium]
MKTKTIRTFIIAAVAAVVGTVGVVGAASTILTREQIRDELAEKNSYTEEFQEIRNNIAEAQRENPFLNPEKGVISDPEDVHLSPAYEDVVVEELIVTEWDAGDYKMAGLSDLDHGVLLRHDDAWGGIGTIILPDDNGGYAYYPNGENITDAKLLSALAEGAEKYGDTFTIWY